MKSTQVIGKKTFRVVSGLTSGWMMQAGTTNFSGTDMLAIGNLDFEVVRAPFIIQTEANMKESGNRTLRTAMVFSPSKMVQSMMGPLITTAWLTETFKGFPLKFL